MNNITKCCGCEYNWFLPKYLHEKYADIGIYPNETSTICFIHKKSMNHVISCNSYKCNEYINEGDNYDC